MFRDSDIEQIGYEYGKVKSFDDIVICYKKEQRFRDTYIDTEYIQVKFHLKQSDEITMDNLLDPAFINAKTNSFLQNVVNAYKNDKIDFSRIRFTMYSVWRIRPGDILNKLISNTNKADLYETDREVQNLIDWVCLSEQIKENNNTIRNLTGEYKKIEPDCREGVRAQLERMKELCKERNNLYEKQNDLKGQKWKIEKSLER